MWAAPLLDRVLPLFPAATVRLLQLAPLARLVALPTLPVAAVVAVALTMPEPATRVALAGSLVAVVEAAAHPAVLAARAELGLTAK